LNIVLSQPLDRFVFILQGHNNIHWPASAVKLELFLKRALHIHIRITA